MYWHWIETVISTSVTELVEYGTEALTSFQITSNFGVESGNWSNLNRPVRHMEQIMVLPLPETCNSDLPACKAIASVASQDVGRTLLGHCNPGELDHSAKELIVLQYRNLNKSMSFAPMIGGWFSNVGRWWEECNSIQGAARLEPRPHRSACLAAFGSTAWCLLGRIPFCYYFLPKWTIHLDKRGGKPVSFVKYDQS